MKKYYLLIIVIFTCTKLSAKTAEGYIVTLNNDTIAATIKLPGAFGGYNMNKKVEIVDSSGINKIFTPNDIKGYGYTYKSKAHVYNAKIIKDSSLYFLEPVVVGPNTSLYEYYVEIYTGINHSAVQEFFTFEKPGGRYLFMTNFAALETFKQKLKLFYTDNPEAQKLIDTKFNARRHIQKDIKEILAVINKS